MVTVKSKSQLQEGEESFDKEIWFEHISAGRNEDEMGMIRHAYELAKQAHKGQTRATGVPYIMHCLSVADILSELNLDSETIAAALLHDVVEDTSVTLPIIEKEIGAGVAQLVDGVTKMKRLPGMLDKGDVQVSRQDMYVENLRKMILAMAQDVRVVLIKLADRTHNMRTLGALPEAKQQRIARETLEIVAPLANRLGIWQLKWELEDLSLKYLKPQSYHHIASKLDEKRVDREAYLSNFIESLSRHLQQAGVKAEVKGRPKHIYSIWRKMERKNLDFENIYDVRAVRVLVDEVAQCYAVLGMVHSLWPYVRGEFDDYVTTPKENGYSSLHTAVIGPEGKMVEVQIRTNEMHENAELGVAAHWRYKEGTGYDPHQEGKITWLRQVLEWKDEVADAGDFVDQFKSDVLQDRVYVLTPAGKIIDMPNGSTPIDFAYHIHSEVGHRCRGAEVNGHIVPLNYQLHNGEQVKILTIKHGGPSRDWLNPHLGYVRSSRARSHIQHWFKQLNYTQNASEGRETLEKELSRLGVPHTNFEKLAQSFKYNRVDDFLAAIGRNDIKVSQIVNSLQEKEVAEPPRVIRHLESRDYRAESGADVSVEGVGDLLTKVARCCKPVPGDEIIGYITKGRGVSIHRQNCPNALRFGEEYSDRLIEVSWTNQARSTYSVDIQIDAYDRTGLLRDIVTTVTNESINLLASNTYTNQKDNRAFMSLTVEISGIDQLSRLLAKITQLPNVLEARRRTTS